MIVRDLTESPFISGRYWNSFVDHSYRPESASKRIRIATYESQVGELRQVRRSIVA